MSEDASTGALGGKTDPVESTPRTMSGPDTFAPIDLDRESIYDLLTDAGYDPARRTVHNWEGVR